MSRNIVLQTEDGKRVVCNTGRDERLYEAPKNPPNTGTTYTRGTDYYRHVARSGNVYYYAFSWSMWQGDSESTYLVSKDELEERLINLMGGGYWVQPFEDEVERLKELGIDLEEETA